MLQVLCCFYAPNFALIGHYDAEILPNNDSQNGVRQPSWICYDVIIMHQEAVVKVPNTVLNLQVDILLKVLGPFTCFSIMA